MDAIETVEECGYDNALLPVSRKLLARRRELRDIPIESVKASEFWIRRNWEEGLDSLAESIDVDGLQQFPAVRYNGDGTYTLVFGHRRYLACRRSGHMAIPCYILDVTEEEAAWLTVAENGQTRHLHPVDEARMISQMARKYNWSDAEVARHMGWKPNVLNERLAVLALPHEILAMVGTAAQSHFRFTHALTLAKLWDPERSDRQVQVRRLWKKTMKHKLSTLELKALAGLIKDGDFGKLPDKLKEYFMNSEWMTAAMVRLFFHPEKTVPGKDPRAEAMRTAVARLLRGELENLIVKAVKARWSYAKTRQQLLNELGRQVDGSDASNVKQKSSIDRLMSCISALNQQLDGSRDEIEELIQSDPLRLRSVGLAIIKLRKKLHSIQMLASEASGDVNGENGLLEETANANVG